MASNLLQEAGAVELVSARPTKIGRVPNVVEVRSRLQVGAVGAEEHGTDPSGLGCHSLDVRPSLRFLAKESTGHVFGPHRDRQAVASAWCICHPPPPWHLSADVMRPVVDVSSIMG
jgi:hypothetical protein